MIETTDLFDGFATNATYLRVQLYAKIVSMIETTNLFDGFATNATYFRVQLVRKDSDKMN